METKVYKDRLEEAAKLIREGGLVAVPTETVYGLAGSGLSESAVKEIYRVKGRPEIKPLSLMVPGQEAMDRYCLDVSRAARRLAEHFWPGPLTVVLKARPDVPEIVRAGGATVGLRCPDHPLTLELLKLAELPLAAPSANPSGAPSPKTAQAVLSYFDGEIDAVIDGGECGIGLESTIIDMSQKPYRILRRGALDDASISAVLAEGLTVIGITGGTGSGKTTALRELKKRGALVIDCDEVYHELLRTRRDMLREIEESFSGVIVDEKLDRKALGAMVFTDPDALERLNGLTHRYVSEEVQRRLADWAMQGGELAAVDAIELIGSGLAERCEAVIGILASRDRRVQRIMARDGISREYAEHRVDAQRSDSYFEENCTHILRNDFGIDKFIYDFNAVIEEVSKNGRAED